MNNAVMGGIQSIHCYIAMVTHIILYAEGAMNTIIEDCIVSIIVFMKYHNLITDTYMYMYNSAKLVSTIVG